MRWWWGRLCTRPTRLVGFFYSARSLKQQSADRHVAPLGHIILIPSQLDFSLSSLCCVLSREAANTNFIVFGLTWPVLEYTIYRTRGEYANHYTTDPVMWSNQRVCSLNYYLYIISIWDITNKTTCKKTVVWIKAVL